MSSNYPAILKHTDPDAVDVLVDTSGFGNTLSAADIDVLKCFDTLDALDTHYKYGIIGPYNLLMHLYVPSSDPDVIGTKVNSYLAALREEGILTVSNDITDLVVPVSPPDVIAPKINEILAVLRDDESYLTGDFLVTDLVVSESDPDVLGAKMNEIMKNMNTLNLIGAFESISHNDISDNDADNHIQYSLADGTRAFTGTIGGITPVLSTDLSTKGYVDTTIAAVEHGDLVGLSDDDHTQYHNDARALTWLGTRSTTDLSEGTNLYYTDARVTALVDAGFVEDLEVIATVATSTTILDSISYVRQTASGITTTLWASPSAKNQIKVRNRSGGTNTIAGNGTNIEGSGSISIPNGASYDLFFDGTEWTI